LHDVGEVVGPQNNADLRQTKFSKGFHRRPQNLINQDSERQMFEQIREQRINVQKAHRQQNLHKNLQTGSNPITGDVNENKIMKEVAQRKNYPELKFQHEAQRPHDDRRNTTRERFIASEGLTETKKGYSVKEFFGSYDSYL
jgi:uncharacterized membrane protein YkoI